ncbi:helix-turn-helix domain-containing protein [Pseudochrobactrum sp. Wa41.01b-1]|uniref:AraC family transcriptional regulator n=1 Tax=Pseudochrobactrum sp. Wa41.01b-1 TaxID=2864102 RepID=UPI001C69367F|nr:helix-turn-helix domain-containing protein [Pseudochrobactrum sp. Wa41.01b-1]QYM73015.1 helix-turn-helix domain-containing protein [Pseudochrobactrum sp. Wa41.01b-1]
MIFIPLPFVLTILLAIILVQLLRNREAGSRADMFFIALIGTYMLQSVLLGLRWGYDILAVLPVQILLASIIAGLSYLSFRSLTVQNSDDALRAHKIWPHLLPVLAVFVLLLIRRDLAALAIIMIFLAYGLALLRLSFAGPDVLIAARLDGVMRSYRAMQITAAMLIGSVIVDILINFDFLWNSGRYSPSIILVTNILSLLVLGAAAGVALNNRTNADEDERDEGKAPALTSETALTTDEHLAIVTELDALMRDKQLYKDMELNLKRIAHRLRRPPRHVSEAVNRCRGISVSVYVNNFRVEEACRLLRDTDEPVTQITFASGFLTKSNFNREFLRVTGIAPKTYRNQIIMTDTSITE